MSTIIIGDVHGCLLELEALLKKVNYKPHIDKLLFTGDLINGGPYSLETLRFVKNLPQVECVLGNHDLALLALAMNTNSHHMTPCYNKILNANDNDSLIAWLLQLPLVYYINQYNILLVHAGVLPEWSLSQVINLSTKAQEILRGSRMGELMTKMFVKNNIMWDASFDEFNKAVFAVNCLTRIRFCNTKGQLEFSSKGGVASGPPGYKPWFAHDRKPLLDGLKKVRIAFGHWAALNGITNQTDFIALDTGCVWGNKLTALRLDDFTYFSVDSLQSKQF